MLYNTHMYDITVINPVSALKTTEAKTPRLYISRFSATLSHSTTNRF